MGKIESHLTDTDLYSYFYRLVRQVPKGQLTTYGALAKALGDITAARACGYMLSINPDPVGTPCYKVVRTGGEVGKFTHPDGTLEKIRRIESDAISIRDNFVENFEKVFFDGFETDYPLEKMKTEQETMSSLVNLEDDFPTEPLAAVDVSYDDFQGYAAMVILNQGDVTIRTAVMPVNFPYIPGYLSYREFKFIRELAEGFNGLLLIDANGYLHPRRIGLATFTGLMLDVPTIGVAKSILTGKVQDRWIYNNGEKSAYVLAKNTIVSAGNRISLESSIRFLKEKFGEKYPDILKMAHFETVKLRSSMKATV